MNIGSESQLRSQLGAALDLLDPGPLPLGEVVKQGRVVMIRRRVLAALALLVLAAAAATAPRLAEHLAHPSPAAPLRYHVTVNPPGKGAGKHLIAFGKLNKMSWAAKVSLSGGQLNTCFNFDNRGFSCDGVSGGPLNFPANPAALSQGEGQGPAILTMTVRNDVRYLLVSLSNGQIVTLRPVAALGRSHPAYVAFMVPSFSAVTEISAFSASGELGYTVPFTAPTDIQALLWIKPGQPALPRPARYIIGSGRVHGLSWAERLYVGPWGLCLSNNWGLDGPGIGYDISYDCTPVSVDRPVVKPAQIWVQDYSQDHLSFAVIMGSRRFAYVVARIGHGGSFLVKTHRVGAASFVVLLGSQQATRWIAYSAAGQVLGSNSFN